MTKREVKSICQHNINALHVYCRLCDIGMPKKLASKIAKFFEFFTKLFYI